MDEALLHALRHTCVSLLLALAVHHRVVMEMVGHVHLDTQRAALDRLDDELSG